MSDTIEVKLPISGKSVTIRNYTTRADDLRSSQVMYEGVMAGAGNDNTPDLKFPIANVMAAQESYVPRLVEAIDGNSENVSQLLEELRTEDYEVVANKVAEIVEEHSPKVTAAERGKAAIMIKK